MAESTVNISTGISLTAVTSFQDGATGPAISGQQTTDPSGSVGGAYGATLVNTVNNSTATGVPAPSHIPTYSVTRVSSFPPH